MTIAAIILLTFAAMNNAYRHRNNPAKSSRQWLEAAGRKEKRMSVHDVKFALETLRDAIGWVILLAPLWVLLAVAAVGMGAL
jgi:hypothetical protein